MSLGFFVYKLKIYLESSHDLLSRFKYFCVWKNMVTNGRYTVTGIKTESLGLPSSVTFFFFFERWEGWSNDHAFIPHLKGILRRLHTIVSATMYSESLRTSVFGCGVHILPTLKRLAGALAHSHRKLKWSRGHWQISRQEEGRNSRVHQEPDGGQCWLSEEHQFLICKRRQRPSLGQANWFPGIVVGKVKCLSQCSRWHWKKKKKPKHSLLYFQE